MTGGASPRLQWARFLWRMTRGWPSSRSLALLFPPFLWMALSEDIVNFQLDQHRLEGSGEAEQVKCVQCNYCWLFYCEMVIYAPPCIPIGPIHLDILTCQEISLHLLALEKSNMNILMTELSLCAWSCVHTNYRQDRILISNG